MPVGQVVPGEQGLGDNHVVLVEKALVHLHQPTLAHCCQRLSEGDVPPLLAPAESVSAGGDGPRRYQQDFRPRFMQDGQLID